MVVGGTTWQRSRTPYKVAHRVCLCFGSLCLDFVSLASRYLLPDVQVICVALLSQATNSRVLCTVCCFVKTMHSLPAVPLSTFQPRQLGLGRKWIASASRDARVSDCRDWRPWPRLLLAPDLRQHALFRGYEVDLRCPATISFSNSANVAH